MRLKTSAAALALTLTLLGFAPLAQAAGDAARGKLDYGMCFGCHAIGPHPRVKVGPPLDGIVGSRWASYPGFAYSQALLNGRKAGKRWTVAELNAWLISPSHVAPGTKMYFPGMPNPRDRADVIAYLEQFNAQGGKR
ncbi:c-type cytochrome [Acidisoma sp. C75]